MAFVASDGVTQWVMVAPTDGGSPHEIYHFTNDGSLTGTAWTQDGGHLGALRSLPPAGEVWSFPTKGGSPEKSELHARPSGAPTVSPDGTRIAFVGADRKAEIWVMTGLFQDAKPASAR